MKNQIGHNPSQNPNECSICYEEKSRFRFKYCKTCSNGICDDCSFAIQRKHIRSKCPFCREHFFGQTWPQIRQKVLVVELPPNWTPFNLDTSQLPVGTILDNYSIDSSNLLP